MQPETDMVPASTSTNAGLTDSEQEVLRGIESMRPRSREIGCYEHRIRTQSVTQLGAPIRDPRPGGWTNTALAIRTSSRELTRPIQLSMLLALIDVIHDGRRFRTPTTGGIGELSLLFVVNHVEELTAGIYALGPGSPELVGQDHPPDVRRSVNVESCVRLGLGPSAPPSLCALVFADVTAVSEKYTHGALSAATLDCGMLMYAMQLAATEVGLRSCMIGCAMNVQLSQYLPVDTNSVPNLGGVAFGG